MLKTFVLSLLLATSGSLEAQLFSPWSVVVGLGLTDGGDYNARGAFVGGIVHEPFRSGAESPYVAIAAASIGELNAECVSFSGYCFRHFPGWTSLTGGIATRGEGLGVTGRLRAGVGLVGYQERDPSRTADNAQGGVTGGVEFGAELAMARRPGRSAPVISLRGMVFPGPGNAILGVYSAGLGVRF